MSMTKAAQNYAWTELAKRAGVAEGPINNKLAGIPFVYGHPDEIEFDRPGIIVEPAAPSAFKELVAAAPGAMPWGSVSRLMPPGSEPLSDESIPLLFLSKKGKQNGNDTIYRRDDGTIVFGVDIIAATLFMLSRWEETSSVELDNHGRFTSTASVAFKQGFLDRPIVDEYACILRGWIQRLNPSWEPASATFLVQLSHDIDLVSHFPSWHHGFKSLAGGFVKHRDLGETWTTQKKLLTDILMPGRTSQMRGIHLLNEQSTSAGVSSLFNFMAATYSTFDSGYDPAAQTIRNCVNRLSRAGHEIGFHPSYNSFNNLHTLRTEKEKLERAFRGLLDSPIHGGRQHYLRFQVPDTWRHWANIGMRYDSTLGYADHEGFRCGTCHPFTVFDFNADHELSLIEVPLIVMESTLRNYRHLEIDEAHQRIIRLANRCHAVGGTFTLLWHNTSLFDGWSEWGQRYPQIVDDLASLTRKSS